MRAERLLDGPIISPASHPSIGTNIQGPSLIRVPDWVVAPLGRYYLYFADHKGSFIRLAFADHVLGPWRIHPPGTLHLAESRFLTEPPAATQDEIDFIVAAYTEALGADQMPLDVVADATIPHIASPDVHVDHEAERIVMYFHGLDGLMVQVSRVATSSDGLRFDARSEVLGLPYLRAFRHAGWTYALTMPGQLSRSRDGMAGFESGPRLFDVDMRHAALLVREPTLYVFWTRVGDAPERILVSTIDISGDWSGWSESEPVELLRPARTWEGADAPLVPSVRGAATGHVHQLRDPAIFEEDGRVFFLYAVAGEEGIALAEVVGI